MVVSLTRALARKNVACTIFAPDFPRHSRLLDTQGIEVRLFETDWPARWWTAHSHDLADALKEAVPEFNIVHIHELWHHPHYAAAQEAIRVSKPYVISPHGTLQPWALSYRGWKKRLYMRLKQRRLISGAAAIHAITDTETNHIQQNRFTSPVVAIPNGIDPEEFQGLPPGDTFERKYPQLIGKQVILFMGRLHPVKSLDILASAFGQVVQSRNDLYLVIAGPDEDGYEGVVLRHLREAGALDKALFTGMLHGSDRLAAFSRADIFVLPSRTEVLGLAALEAMAAACPVIISSSCGFPEVAQEGGGLVVEPNVPQLARAIMSLLKEPQMLRQMGERGRALVMERYTWDRIAEAHVELYNTVLGSGSPVAP